MSKKGENKKNAGKKKIVDLTSFISADSVKFDPDGSWTGTTADTYYNDEPEQPVQDADDL